MRDGVLGEVRRVESKLEAERHQAQSRLHESTRSIRHKQEELDAQVSQLAQLSTCLNHTGALLEQQQTHSQRLTQSLDSGHTSYERIGEQADRQSGIADATGVSTQAAFERQVLESQESLVHSVEGLSRAVSQQPVPPTREERARPHRRQVERSAS